MHLTYRGWDHPTYRQPGERQDAAAGNGYSLFAFLSAFFALFLALA
jgi:hypothetical protein